MVLVGSVSYKTACLDTRSHRGWAIELAHKLPKRVFSSIPAFVEFERVILKQNTCVQYSQQLILLVFQLVETVYGSKPYISGASLTPQTFTFAMECHGERCVNTFDSNPSALNRWWFEIQSLLLEPQWNPISASGTRIVVKWLGSENENCGNNCSPSKKLISDNSAGFKWLNACVTIVAY